MPNTLLKNRYLVGSQIGSGGMSIVYRGHDIRSGHTVAIKVLKDEHNNNPEFIRRFEREAQLVSAVSHDNIVKLLDVGHENNRHFLVLEYVDGFTLKEFIQKNGALPYKLWLSIAKQMTSGLLCAHQANIIHRDIKSQNILLTRLNYNAKITDFGIAKELYAHTITVTDNGVLGSVHYFSPEHARGEVIDAQSDIYSLGVVLYEMATGHVPFDGETSVSIALKHIQERPIEPLLANPQVTEDMNQIIMRCLEKKRDLRYVTAKQLMYDLNALPQEPPKPNPSTNPEMRLYKSPKLVDPIILPKPHRQKQKKKKGWIVALSIFLPVLFASAFLYGLEATGRPVLSNLFKRIYSSTVPPVGGMTEESGQELLKREGYHVKVVHEMKDNVAVGIIYNQSPAGGDFSPNKEVVIFVSTGSKTCQMPNLKSKDEASAIDAVEALGLVVREIYHMESTFPRGQVFAQEPESGTLMNNGDVVDLYVSTPPITKKVPNVMGMDASAAEERIKKDGFVMGNTHYEPVTGTAPGMIFKQSPDPDADIVEGTAIDIWIASAAEIIYKCQIVVPLEIVQDHSVVTIALENDSNYSVVYRETYDKGTYEIDLSLESITRGDRELIVYINGKQVQRIPITFTFDIGE